MRRSLKRPLVLGVALTLAVALTACGDDDDPSSDVPGVTTSPNATTPTSPPAATTDGAPATGTGAPVGGAQTVATEGGEIDVELTAGSLSLVDVRPAGGWRHTVDEDSDDEIDIDFRNDDGRLLEVSIDLDDGRELDVNLDYDNGPPDGRQTLVVGSVGEVDYAAPGGSLRLVEVRPGDGWTESVDEEDDDGFDLDLRHDDGTTVEVSVEIDD